VSLTKGFPSPKISDAHIPAPSAIPGIDKFVGDYYPLQIFHAFISDLCFHPQPNRRAVWYRQVLSVHCIGENCLRMKGIVHIHAFYITIIRVEIHITCAGQNACILQNNTEWNARQLCNGSPSFFTGMPGDLSACWKSLQLIQ